MKPSVNEVATVAATLEAAFGRCLGCGISAMLTRMHLVPESACADCAGGALRAGSRP